MLTKEIIFCLLFCYSSTALAVFCPGNFNQMNFGDSIEIIIQNCGQPKSHKTYYKEYENTINSPVGGTYGVSTTQVHGNTADTYSVYSSPTYVSQRSVTRIEITELYYKEETLIFENGKLVQRIKNYVNFIPP